MKDKYSIFREVLQKPAYIKLVLTVLSILVKMEETNNKIEMNFLNSVPAENKKEEVVAKPKKKPEEKSALKSGNKTQVAKAPVQRVKIAPYAYVEVSGPSYVLLTTLSVNVLIVICLIKYPIWQVICDYALQSSKINNSICEGKTWF